MKIPSLPLTKTKLTSMTEKMSRKHVEYVGREKARVKSLAHFRPGFDFQQETGAFSEFEKSALSH